MTETMAASTRTPVMPPTPTAAAPSDSRIRAAVEHASVVLTLSWWAAPMAHGTGGRAPWALTVGLVLLLVALVAVPVRRHVPSWALVLAAAVGTAGEAVCVVGGTGWFGATEAASYGLAAGLLLLLVAYARTLPRRLVVVVALCTAGVTQFGWSFQAWWGGGDPLQLMFGTFYWHNQYAAFLLAPALLGMAVAVHGRTPLRVVGYPVSALGAAGIVLSTSRATTGLLLVGWVLVAASVVARSADRRPVVRRLLAATVLATAVTLALPGPPLFSSWHSPLAATQQRSQHGGTAVRNGLARTESWRAAETVFVRHPLTGAGYGSLARASAGHVPEQWVRSPFAHNGYLQALSDGGLLLGLPYLLGCAVVGIALVRRTFARGPDAGPDTWLSASAAVAALLLMAHAGVDFDGSYPALVGMVAVVAGLALSRPGRIREPAGVGTRRTATAALTVLVAAVAVGAATSTGGGVELNAPPPASSLVSPSHASTGEPSR